MPLRQRKYKPFLPLLVLIWLISSCSDTTPTDEWSNIKNGFHKAYVEIMNGNKDEPDFAGAMVDVEKGIIVKICFNDNKCVDNFFAWTEYDHSQTVDAKDNHIYSVYIIPDDWDQAEEEQRKAKEENNNDE